MPGTELVSLKKLEAVNGEALELLQEYYEAVKVVKRDAFPAIDPEGGWWVAYLEGKAVGCVVLRRLDGVAAAGECKRLYVRPVARGRQIADRLMEALEDAARANGWRWVCLDTYQDLAAAVALYRKRGFVDCERYNDNSQATLFLRKDLEGRPNNLEANR